ncbi:ABC transporter ATP-binding protein [Streptomyces sp. NPDC050560]|uniref:ABC transporter ATP-binding protein n=1 Tax=Streptomyces sp. NPDC050560 TaxID=3365630 RepID=UPI0037B11F79
MLDIENLVKIYATSQKKRFGRERAVDDVSLTVGAGEFFTLLGPSGCGKTTLLRCVGGLEDPTSGAIRVGERTLFSSADATNVAVNRRELGMVFQSYAIWPHMTVFANAAYPLTAGRRRASKAEIAEEVGRTLDVMGLGELADRPATALSGGQQQRLALARALVHQPPLLLLDEPLSNLDAKLRQSMRGELMRLQKEMGLTVLYVTHDQSEALAMSSLIAVMNEGRVEQIGTPREIYERPTSWFVGDFVGSANFVDGVVGESTDAGLCTLETPLGALTCEPGNTVHKGQKGRALLRPERIGLAAADPAADPRRRGVVRSAVYEGDGVDYEIEVAGQFLKVRSGPHAFYSGGDEVTLRWSDEPCALVDHAAG